MVQYTENKQKRNQILDNHRNALYHSNTYHNKGACKSLIFKSKEDFEQYLKDLKMFKALDEIRKAPKACVIDPKKAEQFKELHETAKQFAGDNDGKIVSVDISPNNISGSLVVEFLVLDLGDEPMNTFRKMISLADMLSMDVTNTDHISLSLDVSNLWIVKLLPEECDNE